MATDSASANKRLPRLLITPGEPAGVGPELLIKLATRSFAAQLLVLGDSELLRAAARRLGSSVMVQPTTLDTPRQQHVHGTLQCLELPLAQPRVQPGTPLPVNAAVLISALKLATQACLNGQADALVTGPLDKAVINRAGIAFTGHTELLAQLTGTADVVMLLATNELKVALLTTHLPLRAVAASVTQGKLETTLNVIHREMGRLYGLTHPRIAVCGLNPHAGDGGYLGDEEQLIMQPLLDRLRQQGLQLLGPLPADSAFTPQALANCDLVLAMYHDQGLPVLKHSAGQDAVNITLGLPILRTSVDHGTAYDLAGSGRANSASFERAIRTAIELSSPP